MEPFTIEQFKAALPEKMHKALTPALVAKMGKTLSEPDMFEAYRENLLSYTSIMKEGRFNLHNYIDAVKYVSHKLRGFTSIRAFSVTFPEKIQKWTAEGVSGKDVASYVTSYNKSKLVTGIMEQCMVPTWIVNQDVFQQAINTQAEIMLDKENSATARSFAANSLMLHLKQPETKKLELAIGVAKDSSIQALRDATMEYVAEQRRAIAAGVMTPQQAAHAPVILDNDTGDTV